MRILAFDTAGPVIGVALLTGDRADSRTARVTRQAEALLVPWALELVASAALRLSDLDGIAVSVGPGAFTGLRVGLSTACGLAQALERPIWPGCSLRSRAGLELGTVAVLAMLDARKGRVYASLVDADGRELRPPSDVAPEVAVAWVDGPTVAVGEGALVYAQLLAASGVRISERADDPGVEVLARLAAHGLAAGEGVDPVDVRPIYLREPDAKLPGTR